MTFDMTPVVVFLVAISIIPAIVVYSRLSLWLSYRNKKKKIAEFLERAAEEQMKAAESTDNHQERKNK